MYEQIEQRDCGGHFVLGGVYWNSDIEVPFTVTSIRYDKLTYILYITTADLDYPQYGRSERTRVYAPWLEDDFPPLWEPDDYTDDYTTGY